MRHFPTIKRKGSQKMYELTPQRFADDFIFLEAPRWHGGSLWVPDVFDSTLYRVDMDGGREVVIDNLPARPNSLGFLPGGAPLIVSSVKRQLLKLVDGELLLHADLSGHANGDLNDFAMDKDGRVYIGDFGYDLFKGEERRETSIHIVDADGSVRHGSAGVEFPNGAVILDDGRMLVVAETWRGRLTAFDRAPDGSLSNKRLFADLPGREPDGMCADAEGGVWVCSFNTGEVIRIKMGGEITHHLRLPGSAVACELGGDDGQTLFITSYDGTIPDQQAKKRFGALSKVRVDIPGART